MGGILPITLSDIRMAKTTRTLVIQGSKAVQAKCCNRIPA